MTTTHTDAPGRTTETPVAEYDANRRAQARAAGQPVERTLAPSIFGSLRLGGDVDLAMVWTDENGTLVHYCPRDNRAPIRVTIDALDRALTLPPRDPNDPDARHRDLESPQRLVVPDYQTLRRLAAWVSIKASTAAADDHTPASVYRRLQVASRLVSSTRLIVLTRALARKFWLPAQYDPENFGAWRRAFRYGSGATTLSVMTGLVDLACEGKVHAKWSREAFNSESYALLSAMYPGLRSAVAAFRRIETADAASRAILTTDPLLRDRGVLDGSVSTLRVLNIEQGRFTAVASTPFKLRAGKSVLLMDPDSDDVNSGAETRLEAVTVARLDDSDQLIATVAKPTPRKPSALSNLVQKVAGRGGQRVFHVTEAPYLQFISADSRASRWTVPSTARLDMDRAEGKPRRDIPLDIIVAGAPTA